MDAYAKGVLTVIAIALCILAAQGFVTGSKAQIGAIQKVQICDFSDKCLLLDAVRKEASGGNRFLIFTLPITAQRSDY
jgi:hypothetical protein